MNFASDNTVGASSRILDALVAANADALAGYGNDPHTARAKELLADVFGCEVHPFLVATGTASNALALGAICPPWGATFCHRLAHIANDESGAPELFTSGAKLIGIDGDAGKIDPRALRDTLKDFPRGVVRQVQPAALSLSQATECGTLYSCDEITELTGIAHQHGIAVHMDGARFANALVALGCSPAEMSWKAGVDVVSFGATKNGALACEAVIFFDKAKAETFAYQCKRGGHVLSKGRLLGAQMAAYLADDHWLGLARHANAMAASLAKGLSAIPGLSLAWQVEANQLFVSLPRRIHEALKQAGATYYEWSHRDIRLAPSAVPDTVLVRLVTSFATTTQDVSRFVEAAQKAAA